MFGAGYPSLPAVSLDQFYEQQYREQVEKQREEVPQQKSRVPDQGDDEEEETEESLRKEREFDDFKDSELCGLGISDMVNCLIMTLYRLMNRLLYR